MSSRFQLSYGWGLFGAAFGAAVGVAICWLIGAEQSYWIRTSLALALVFGVLACFFGDETVQLVFEVLGYLIS